MGIGIIISGLVKNVVRSTINFDLAIEPLLQKLETSCPPREELEKIIIQKNQIAGSLSQVQSSLTTVVDTANTVGVVLTTLDTIVTIIKLLPIPTAVPPGVGIPISIITTFADILDRMGTLIKEGKGTIEQIAPAIGIINQSLTNIISKLNALDILIVACFEAQTADLTDEERIEYFSELGIGTQIELNTGVDIGETELLNRLSNNSTNPYYYRNWRLVIDYDDQNQFSFPRRRIIATEDDIFKRIYGPLSYSSSVQVLINSMKWEIDKFYNINLEDLTEDIPDVGNPEPNPPTNTDSALGDFDSDAPPPPPPNLYPPIGRPGVINHEVAFSSGMPYRYQAQYEVWYQHTITYYPFLSGGTSDGATRTHIYWDDDDNRIREIWKWVLLKQQWELESTEILGG